MYTPELHATIGPNKMVCRVPIVKKVGIHFILTGTLIVNTFEGLTAIDLTKNWIRLTQEMVTEVIASLTSRNSQDVWIQEKQNLSYSATLVQLPDDVAKKYGFHDQERVTGHGECRHNEIVIADEVFKTLYLKDRDITPMPGPNYKVEGYTLAEALNVIRITGQLPQLAPSCDQAFARKFDR